MTARPGSADGAAAPLLATILRGAAHRAIDRLRASGNRLGAVAGITAADGEAS